MSDRENTTKVKERGYSLPKGYCWNPLPSNDIKNGKYFVMDTRNVIVAELSYKNNKLNGICSFFNDGVLREKLYYKNDCCEGLGFEVLYGREFAWYTFSEGKKVANVFDIDGGYKKEINIETKEVMSICSYNEHFERNGICFLFQNDQIHEQVLFKDGMYIRRMKSFSQNRMTEYNEKNEIIYNGSFNNDYRLQYPRHEYGEEYQSGDMVYKGNWQNGSRYGEGTSYRHNHVLFTGNWKENVPHEYGELYDDSGNVLHKGVWNDGVLIDKNQKVIYSEEKEIQVTPVVKTEDHVTVAMDKTKKKKNHYVLWITCVLVILVVGGIFLVSYLLNRTIVIQNRDDLTKLESAKYVQIQSNCCNEDDLIELNWSGFKRLEKVEIGDNCFNHVSLFKVSSLPSLKQLIIGKNSFSQTVDGTVRITNCPSLEEFHIKPYSFIGYDTLHLDCISND